MKGVLVVGAGQMGCGIAQVAAAADLEVFLSDQRHELAEAGRARIAAQLRRQVDKGKLGAESAAATLERIRLVTDWRDAYGIDVAIEAAPEQLELKRKLLTALDAALAPHAVLASNTSSLSITTLAAATRRPKQVIGMHFMNPVVVMKLVEVVRGLQTSDATSNVITKLVERLGKVAVHCSDVPGFIVNRLLIPMLNEAVFVLESGLATCEHIDAAMQLGTNQPLGPLALADLIGLDTVLAISETLQRELGDDKYRPAPLLRRYVTAGWLGKKTGRGFYEYPEL